MKMTLKTSSCNRRSTKASYQPFRRGLSGERGTSLLEMALLTPVLVLLLLGIIDVGRYAETAIVVANAARAGTQYGAQNFATAADSTGIENTAVSDSQNVLTASQVTPYVLCGCASTSLSTTCPATCSTGHPLVYVQVIATGTFKPLISYPGIPSPITITGKSEMRVAE